MKIQFNRRQFLKTAALSGGALYAGTGLPNLLAADATANSKKVACVQIGCGGRAGEHFKNTAAENLIALVDPDEKKLATAKKTIKKYGTDPDKVQTFSDYRTMFDKIGKDIEAVFITTPNHHHACASTMAIQAGKAVYCEKPLTHDVSEARRLRTLAAHSKMAAQMGNQGHCEDGYRRLCEFVWGGVVGNITETHSWTNRANGGSGPRPPEQPAPAGMNWDAWIGPAPFRKFHEDLHPHEWHGWYDFGNGSIGNMGCHVLDGVFWALKIEHPVSMEAEEVRGGSAERYPTGSRVRWDIPARENMPALKVYWYEGLNKNAKSGPKGDNRAATGDDRNFPPVLKELQKQFPDEEMDGPDSGTIYVGEKGYLYTGTYGGKFHILPLEKMNQIKQPPRSLPRPKNVMTDFLDAVREGKKQTSADFDYGARLTEFCLLGNLAQHAGVGKKIEWDGPAMKVTNDKKLNEWLKRPYRKGWPT